MRLSREVAFGKASSFKHVAEFTAPEGERRPSGRPGSTYVGDNLNSNILTLPLVPSQRRRPATAGTDATLVLRPISPTERLDASQRPVHAWPPLENGNVPIVVGESGGAPQQPEVSAANPDTLAPSKAQALARRVRFGINASWVVNIVLFLAKVVAFAMSMSYSVLASAIDSLVDILSQGLLAVAEYQAAHYDPRYPIGRTRMAELSVIGCAIIMFISTTLVIREASGVLDEGIHGHMPSLDATPMMFAILGAASLLKVGLWLYCRQLRKNPIMTALSQDHLNDLMSNAAAVGGAAIAFYVKGAWFVDPMMALIFSAIIIFNWLRICKEQAENIAGIQAPAQLTAEIEQLTSEHHQLMQLDRVIAYHHGARYIAEVEITLPPDMTVRESHDIALQLQHKIESLEDVERAYVHVDWQAQSVDEHKVEFNLKHGVKNVMQALSHYEAALHLTKAKAPAGGPAASNGVSDKSQQPPQPSAVNAPLTINVTAGGAASSASSAPPSVHSGGVGAGTGPGSRGSRPGSGNGSGNGNGGYPMPDGTTGGGARGVAEAAADSRRSTPAALGQPPPPTRILLGSGWSPM